MIASPSKNGTSTLPARRRFTAEYKLHILQEAERRARLVRCCAAKGCTHRI